MTVIVPVHDRVADLERCLAALGRDVPGRRRRRRLARSRGSRPRVRRRTARPSCDATRNGGPGRRAQHRAGARADRVRRVRRQRLRTAARTGSAALLAHLADPLVAARSRRASSAQRTTRGRAATPASAAASISATCPPASRRGSRVTYVPSAALVVRRAALRDVGVRSTRRCASARTSTWSGDCTRRAGASATTRPCTVTHREPATWRALLARRFRYGTSAGAARPTAPGRDGPLVLHPWPALTVAGVLARRPARRRGAAAAGARRRPTRTLRAADVPTAGLLPAMADAVRQTWLGVGRYLTQFAAPALLAALCVATRRDSPPPSLLLGPPLAAWAPRRVLDPVRFTLAAARRRDRLRRRRVGRLRSAHAPLRPVRPVVTWRPLRIDTRRS